MNVIGKSLRAVAIGAVALAVAIAPFEQARAEAVRGASVSFHVERMTCACCRVAVRTALTKLEGVKDARVDVARKSATVDYDPAKVTLQQLVDAVNRLGYQATLPAKSGE